MKKTIVSIMLLIVVAVNVYIGFRNYQPQDEIFLNLCLDECEALAGCDVYNHDHTLIVSCEGDEGVCYRVTNTLYCSGKRTNN